LRRNNHVPQNQKAKSKQQQQQQQPITPNILYIMNFNLKHLILSTVAVIFIMGGVAVAETTQLRGGNMSDDIGTYAVVSSFDDSSDGELVTSSLQVQTCPRWSTNPAGKSCSSFSPPPLPRFIKCTYNFRSGSQAICTCDIMNDPTWLCSID
jgi:hypothetical protein